MLFQVKCHLQMHIYNKVYVQLISILNVFRYHCAYRKEIETFLIQIFLFI